MDTPSGIHFDPDGTVRFVTDSQAIRLRRPTLSEYADIVDLSLGVDYKVIGTRQQLVDLNKKITAGKANETDIDEARRINRYVQTAKADVVRHILTTLGDVAEVGELPPWAAFSAHDVLSKLFGHWETVPFHGSGQNGT